MPDRADAGLRRRPHVGGVVGGVLHLDRRVSGRSVNQHRTLASLTNMGQLAPVIESMTQTLGPESVKAFMLWIFNTVDTELARRVMGFGKEDSNTKTPRHEESGSQNNAQR